MNLGGKKVLHKQGKCSRPAVAEVKGFGIVDSIRNKCAERIAMGVADLTAVRLHKFFSCMNAEISISCSHII